MPLPHGGNIYHYSRKYGIPVEEILDFSASINPLGVPPRAREALKGLSPGLINYPDPDCKGLVRTLADHFGVGEKKILVGNGSTELIYLLPRALRPRRVLIPSPTFSDYARASSLAGAEIRFFPLREEEGFMPDMDRLKKVLASTDMLFLCNPNNPTSALMEHAAVLYILKAASRLGVFTVVDEAFIEYAPEASVIREAAGMGGAAVIRNFTKFYGMPGLRAGYIVSGRAVIQRLKAAKEPWSVSHVAQIAAEAALGDEAYARKSLALMERERKYLFKNIASIPGLKPLPPSANFILVKLMDKRLHSGRLAEKLASKGVLIRDCSNFMGLGSRFIRVAVRTRVLNRVLIAGLRQAILYNGPGL